MKFRRNQSAPTDGQVAELELEPDTLRIPEVGAESDLIVVPTVAPHDATRGLAVQRLRVGRHAAPAPDAPVAAAPAAADPAAEEPLAAAPLAEEPFGAVYPTGHANDTEAEQPPS
jgi:hypothetical protein